MGRGPRNAPALAAESVRSIADCGPYIEFSGAGVRVGLTFLTPALPDDLDVLSRPVTYIGGRSHPTMGAITSRRVSRRVAANWR